MTKTFTFEDATLTFSNLNQMLEDLHGFINSLHRPKFFDSDWTEKTHRYSQELSEQISELCDYVQQKKRSFSDSLSLSLTQVQGSLQEYSAELADNPSNKRLKVLYQELANDYEELLTNIRSHNLKKIKAIHLKPVNYVRNIFHAFNGLTCVLLYQFLLTREMALGLTGGFLAVFGILELTRRFSARWNNFLVDKVFGMISRPHERSRTNGSTYFALAMFIIVLFFDKPIAQLSILILGFADPAASVFGKLWGRRKLFRDKSFVGTGTFFAVAFSATIIFLSLAVPAFSFSYALIVAGVVSLFATATELFSTRVDDNFTIPMACALIAAPFFWII